MGDREPRAPNRELSAGDRLLELIDERCPRPRTAVAGVRRAPTCAGSAAVTARRASRRSTSRRRCSSLFEFACARDGDRSRCARSTRRSSERRLRAARLGAGDQHRRLPFLVDSVTRRLERRGEQRRRGCAPDHRRSTRERRADPRRRATPRNAIAPRVGHALRPRRAGCPTTSWPSSRTRSGRAARGPRRRARLRRDDSSASRG